MLKSQELLGWSRLLLVLAVEDGLFIVWKSLKRWKWHWIHLAGQYSGVKGGLEYGRGGPHQPNPSTCVHRCRCSLPGLTGFTTETVWEDQWRPPTEYYPRVTGKLPTSPTIPERSCTLTRQYFGGNGHPLQPKWIIKTRELPSPCTKMAPEDLFSAGRPGSCGESFEPWSGAGSDSSCFLVHRDKRGGQDNDRANTRQIPQLFRRH